MFKDGIADAFKKGSAPWGEPNKYSIVVVNYSTGWNSKHLLFHAEINCWMLCGQSSENVDSSIISHF